MSLVLSNKGKGMQSSSEQPLVGEERYVTTRITAAKETKGHLSTREKVITWRIQASFSWFNHYFGWFNSRATKHIQ